MQGKSGQNRDSYKKYYRSLQESGRSYLVDSRPDLVVDHTL